MKQPRSSRCQNWIFSVAVLLVILILSEMTPNGQQTAIAYVCNTGKDLPLSVTMNRPAELKGWNNVQTVSTDLVNSGTAPLTVDLRYSALDTIVFPESSDPSKKILTAKVTIPANSTLQHIVKLSAGVNSLTGHYPIRLDASFTHNGSTKHIQTVYPVQTTMPARTDWHPVNDLVGKINIPWNEKRCVPPKGTPLVFPLNGNTTQNINTVSETATGQIVVVPGELGLADGTISVQWPDTAVVYSGLHVWIEGRPLYELSPGPLKRDGPNGFRQTIQLQAKTETLFWQLEQRLGGLSISVRCSDPIAVTQVELGPCNRTVKGVWFGHGWYVKEPGPIKLPSDGAGFSTSYAAFDYDNKISVLMASSFVIDLLRLEPKTGTSTISVKAETTVSLIPNRTDKGGAMACALTWRSLSDKRPAPGVQAKAGRYIVDIWNGRYSEHAKLIREAARYGLKNDLAFISHNWQRFRYDHRLPDVWPPNPLFGTKAEMYDALRAARENGWYFGTHNNVIDYYPDSTEFSYDNVAFMPNGMPQKAYRNVFLDAQSYRLAPHRAPSVLGKTLDEMNADGFVQDLCFVDVLSSYIALVSKPYYDRNGKYFSRQQSVDDTGNVFVTFRNRQDPALKALAKKGEKDLLVPRQSFTVSESGHDLLTGKLDGADCQFLNLSKTSGEYCWLQIADFKDAERVPWFDAVNHRKFIQHGAGYSIRFEGGRGRELHGIDSDDYISTEILTGHPLMVDGYCRDVKEVLSGYVRSLDMPRTLRQVVRKYYLAQGVARELSNADLVSHEFADGDLHRQKITWSTGAVIHVNRGISDWHVDGFVLPQYGFLVRNRKTGLFAAVHRINGRVVEQSSCKEGEKLVRYVNGRNREPDGLLPVSPKASIKESKPNRMKLHIDWQPFASKQVPDRDFQVTFYLVRRKSSETSFGDDYRLKTVTANLRHSLEVDLTIPEKLKRNYDLLVTVVPLGKEIDNVDNRLKLLATPSFFYRYHLGTVVFDNKRQYTFEQFEEKDVALYERLFAPSEPIDFGFCKTKGGFRIETNPGQSEPRIIQLPDEKPTQIILKK